jgi:hypothetical protein
MSANHNLDPYAGRADSQPDDAERDDSGAQAQIQSPVQSQMPTQSQTNPRPQMYAQVHQNQDITRPMEAVKLPTQEPAPNGQPQNPQPGQRPGSLPMDCTVQMRARGKTREMAPRNPDAPWEKPEEPEEEEAQILPLPVPPPPPSSTNHRLPAMQRPYYADDDENQTRQTASGNFSASKDSPALRQAVRYKSGTSPAVQTPKMVDPGPIKKKRPPANAPYAGATSSSDTKRARVNPNLLKPENSEKPARKKSASFYEQEEPGNYDDSYDTKPDRFKKLSSSSESQPFSWSELQHVIFFYFTEVWSMFGHPREFLADHGHEGNLAEPIAFVILSAGIAGGFLTLGGAIYEGISMTFGTIAYVIIGAMAAHYAGQWLGEPDCDIKRCFRILAYCQAPLLVSWIRLGAIPVGWLCAAAYSAWLTVVGLEEVFGMNRNHAIMIAVALVVVIRGLLHLAGL